MKNKFDFDAYNENISLLLSMARDEYKRHFIELPAIQDKSIKTYLWISAALIGLQVTAFDKLGTVPFSSKFWFAISVLIAFFSFCFGVDTLRGREKSVFGVKSYNKVMNDAHSWAHREGSNRKLKISLINFFETAINAEKRINSWRAKRLRRMSCLLLLSGGATGMSVVCKFIN